LALLTVRSWPASTARRLKEGNHRGPPNVAAEWWASINAGGHVSADREFDRLLDAETRERDERRGIEASQSSLLAAFLVALGLVGAAATQVNIKSSAPAEAFLGLAAGLSIVSVFLLALFFRRQKGRLDTVGIIEQAETDAAKAIEEQKDRVTNIQTQNIKRLWALRWATIALGATVTAAVIGAALLVIGGNVQNASTAVGTAGPPGGRAGLASPVLQAAVASLVHLVGGAWPE
jgi:hypothetical protein